MTKIINHIKKLSLKYIAAIFVSIFVIYYLGVRFFYTDIATSGQFGDMFGGINAFFSGLAFLGIIYAILLQKEELSLQRKELKLTRKELKRTAEAQEKSEKALSKQAESLKMTAKLNGLSSLLQYELSKTDKNNIMNMHAGIAPFNARDIEDIKNEIRHIVDNK